MPKPRTPAVKLRLEELVDAIEELGAIHRACAALDFDRRHFYRILDKEPELAEQVRIALEVGKAKRKDWLESLAYSMAPDNPTMVMFLLKREDPSYRESYNVTTSTTPTDYVIDLSAPSEGPAFDADGATTKVLE